MFMFGTRKLGRTSDQRKAMLRQLTTDLLENGKIETTFTKEAVANKLFKEIAPKYADRNGGYTRVTRLGARRGDAAEMAVIELV